MTNSEKIVYSIFGVTNKSTQDMAYAVDRMAELLFDQNQKLEKLSNKLNNPGFLAKAPEQVVAAEKERAEKLTALIAQLEAQEASL